MNHFIKGEPEMYKAGPSQEAEDLNGKAETLQALQYESTEAENGNRKLQQTISQVVLDTGKAQCDLASLRVCICELQKDTQLLIHDVTALGNEITKRKLTECSHGIMREAYQRKMRHYSTEHSFLLSKIKAASELESMQQEYEKLQDERSRSEKSSADRHNLKEQMRELETKLQVLNADRQLWMKKVEDLKQSKLSVVQNTQQLKKRNHAKLLCLKRQVQEVRCKNAKWIDESVYLRKLIDDLKQNK